MRLKHSYDNFLDNFYKQNLRHIQHINKKSLRMQLSASRYVKVQKLIKF